MANVKQKAADGSTWVLAAYVKAPARERRRTGVLGELRARTPYGPRVYTLKVTGRVGWYVSGSCACEVTQRTEAHDGRVLSDCWVAEAESEADAVRLAEQHFTRQAHAWYDDVHGKAVRA